MLMASELAKISAEFPHDVVRKRNCVGRVGRMVPDGVLILAWARYSDNVCASWLTLPEDDIALTVILVSYLLEVGTPIGEAICASLEEEGKAGSAVVVLPSELLQRLGWKAGDTLSLSEDSQGGLTVRRA